jgi:two-component system, OmpR family, response regulator
MVASWERWPRSGAGHVPIEQLTLEENPPSRSEQKRVCLGRPQWAVGGPGCVRILIVHDVSETCLALVDFLQQHSVAACWASDDQKCRDLLGRGNVSLVVLEDRLGRGDSCGLFREMRSQWHVPVMITTERRDEAGTIAALEFGADDYLVRPFSSRELLARARSILRRYGRRRAHAAAEGERAIGGYRFQGWKLERGNRCLTDPEGKLVPLSRGEYALLVAFLNMPHHPLTREQLMNASRVHEDAFDRAVDVQVLRLRRKLDPDPTRRSLIQTQRGRGYVFTAEVEEFE